MGDLTGLPVLNVFDLPYNVIESPQYSPDTTGDQNQCKLVIVEEPCNTLRFRYLSELQGTPHGPLVGARSTKGHRTYPTVKLCGYSGEAFIQCWLVNGVENTLPHVHDLAIKGKKGQGISYYPHTAIACPENNHTVSFEEMVVLRSVTSKTETRNKYKEKVEKWLNRFERISGISSSGLTSSLILETTIKKMDKTTVYLYFEAVTPEFNQLAFVMSGPIKDMKNRETGELKIISQSHFKGKREGGDEIFLFTSRLPTNFKIEFVDDEGWNALGEFQKHDIHQHCAVKFRTPPHPHGGKTYFRIVRESDNCKSNDLLFLYEEQLQNISNNQYRTVDPAPVSAIRRTRPADETSIPECVKRRKGSEGDFLDDILSKHQVQGSVVTEKIEPEFEDEQEVTFNSLSLPSSHLEQLLEDNDIVNCTNLPSAGDIDWDSPKELPKVQFDVMGDCSRTFQDNYNLIFSDISDDHSVTVAVIALSVALYMMGVFHVGDILYIYSAWILLKAFVWQPFFGSLCLTFILRQFMLSKDVRNYLKVLTEQKKTAIVKQAIMAAIESDWIDGLKELQRVYEYHNLAFTRVDDSYLIHFAVKKSTDCVKFIVQNSDPKCLCLKDSDKKTPLHIAFELKQSENARFLIDFARQKSMLRNVLSQTDNDRNNILHLAAMNVFDLDECSLDLIISSMLDGIHVFKDAHCSVIYLARLNKNYAFRKSLLKNWQEAVKTAVRLDDRSDLQKLLGILKLDCLGSIQIDDSYLIHMAALKSTEILAAIVLRSKPECLLLKNPDQKTPMHLAIEQKRWRNVYFLLEHGQKSSIFTTMLSETDGDGNNILHLAAMYSIPGGFNILTYLPMIIAMNDKFYLKNHSGKTPVDLAKINENIAALELMEGMGQNVQEEIKY